MLLLCFELAGQRFALKLHHVEKVVRAAEITPLPDAPETVLGLVNVHGRFVPAVDVRGLFGLPAKQMELCDRLIVVRAKSRSVLIVVDGVDGVTDCPAHEIAAAEGILPAREFVDGVVKLGGGMASILDPDRLFSFLEKEETPAGA